MDKETTEILEIQDFLSIKYIKWKFEKFNIITGDMGSGKSVCIKLLKYFEDIIPRLLVLPYENFLKNLETNQFFDFLVKDFSDIFVFTTSEPDKQFRFKVSYIFSYNEVTFDATISSEKETGILFKSVFLESLLKEWFDYSQKKGVFVSENVTPDGFDEIKQHLYNELLKKFGNHFPMSTTFVPASRAAIAFGSSHTDDYLKEYKELVDVLPRFISSKWEIVNTILKAEMRIENGFLFLESNDGRKVPIAKASSGQQEIVYVLMLLDKLGNFRYSYGKRQSVFIEEPSAHLFPLEQKQTIELIVVLFNTLKGNGSPIRFFITTHSPYVLNSLNNSLTKGALIDKYKDKEDEINKKFDIPYLNADEVSALFINNDGTVDNMLDIDEKYMFADKIAEISYDIDKISADLSIFKNELCDKKELLD